MPMINCKNLVFGYGGKPVSTALNFSVNEGDYLAIVGENGSGKTTLMKTLLGLIQPISGCLTYSDGYDRNCIGYLPQRSELEKEFPASVKEIVMSGNINSLHKCFFYNKKVMERTERIMRDLNVDDLQSFPYGRLSGGQQQRVLLARALCATKNIMLLDEPVTGLDQKSAQEMYEMIEHLNKERRITILMISHDIPSVVCYASHILQLGDHVFFGTKNEYLQRENV